MKPGETVYIGDGAYLHFDGYGFWLKANDPEHPTDEVYIDGPHAVNMLIYHIQAALSTETK